MRRILLFVVIGLFGLGIFFVLNSTYTSEHLPVNIGPDGKPLDKTNSRPSDIPLDKGDSAPSDIPLDHNARIVETTKKK